LSGKDAFLYMQGCKQALERDNGLLSYCTVFLGMLANTSPRGIRARNRTKRSLREVRGAMMVLLSAAVNATHKSLNVGVGLLFIKD
jgi:hypothetical protein